MNVKELKERLNNLPDDMEVFMGEVLTDFTYRLVNGVKTEEIGFCEEEGGEELARDTVVILTED